MDSEEQLAAAVVAYILENKKKEKNGKTLYLSKTLAHAKRCSWFLQHSYIRIKDKRCGGIYQISIMSPYLFDELLQHIETDDIHKEATFM